MEKVQPTIGHVHLKVSDLERAIKFYKYILGFDITSRYGDGAVFLSSGGYHHHLGLNTWESKGAAPAPHGHTGLYHVAFLYPDRKSLAKVLKRIVQAKYPIDGAADHGVSEAIYLHDPDGNGVEIYCDRPKESWKVANDGEVEMSTLPLDLQSLLSEAE